MTTPMYIDEDNEVVVSVADENINEIGQHFGEVQENMEINIENFDINVKVNEGDRSNHGDVGNDGDQANVGEDVDVEVENDDTLEPKKRKKTSKVWEEFKEIILPDGQKKGECFHCKKKLSIGNTGATTQFRRHLERCVARMRALKKQNILHFQTVDNASGSTGPLSQEGSILGTFKYDKNKIRELIAHYILINEKPFSIVEEFGFNLILKAMSPYFIKCSRATTRNDVMTVYEKEKKKLKNLLKNISRISFTTDLWKSKNQRISYMVVTAHYVDSTWKLQKCVLSFLHLPPPHTASEIVDTFYKALCDWGVENKVFTISVDNASNNDRAIKLLKDSFRVKKKLFFGGKLFHVRCCAHILNLLVKDGIKSIEFVVEKIRDTVSFVNSSEARLMRFADVVQQLQLPTRKLVMDCSTRWNFTYNMLVVALQLRETFFSYSEREVSYVNCPTEEEWSNIEKVCDVLGYFNEATNIISGTEYPTSNLFLSQICMIKKVLDDGAISLDFFIKEMTTKMKAKFDKYWGECNLLMAFGAVMDPRMKFVVIDFAYPLIYNGDDSLRNVSLVRRQLYKLYEEYVLCYEPEIEGAGDTFRVGTSSVNVASGIQSNEAKKYSGWHDFTTYVTEKTTKRPTKSDLDNYLDNGLELCVLMVRNLM